MSEKLISAIKAAKESLVGLELDEVEKGVAMAKAIDYFLSENKQEGASSRVKKVSDVPPEVEEEKGQAGTDEKKVDFWSNLAEASGLEIKKLKDIFSVKDKQVTLIVPKVKGEKKGEKQSSVALLVLYAYMNGMGMEWIPGTLLVESVKDFGTHDTNFSRNLDKQENWFRKDGSGKWLNYKLSSLGIAEAKSYLLAF